MNKQFFDNIVGKISATLPPIPSGLKNDFEQSVQSILRNAFDKMDLVTREDFEVQAAVLQKTRIKLEQLEKKLTEFEEKLDIK